MRNSLELLGEHPAIAGVRDQVRRLLELPARRFPPTLIQGETGTGKGLLARWFHHHGPRRDQPFVDVNCAAIPGTLLESEMFGFERGAFTDARQRKDGLFQIADGGVIFLDEVGLLSLEFQAKLLKVLEERSVRRLGGIRVEAVDLWVISASNEDLLLATRERRFREDLYHRLAVVILELPPLRGRGDDIALLAEHFIAHVCQEYELAPKVLSSSATAALIDYAWPGNVRELRNVLERAILLSPQRAITAEDLRLPKTGVPAPLAASTPGESSERGTLHRALCDHDWNISRAATTLGISRNTLRHRMALYSVGAAGAAAVPRRPLTRMPGPRTAEETRARCCSTDWCPRRVALVRAKVPFDAASTPELIHAAVCELGNWIDAFGGRVDELGRTGFIATFGLLAESDASIMAGLGAIAMLQDPTLAHVAPVRPLLRIAIWAGEMWVSGRGAGARIDLDGKRQAWRILDALITAAEPGTIVTDACTAECLRPRFEIVSNCGSSNGSVFEVSVGLEGAALGQR